ncbi:MAG: YibE/F family protein, partial [Patescibacteria group bacterium]
TFFIILKFIIPEILDGGNPLLISIIGSLFILVLSIYITEGIKKSSTIAIISVLISLVVTGVISVWFTTLTKLTGFASDEAMYLVGLAGGNVNIKGLLLAGIIIGALGVLDDVVVSQVSLVKELKEANPKLPKRLVYSQAMRVGISHLSSMVNTLFLAYAGAALPLLILFSIKEPPFFSFHQVINNEIIATEIVRSLTGSIGLVLAVPIATLLAVHFVKSKE